MRKLIVVSAFVVLFLFFAYYCYAFFRSDNVNSDYFSRLKSLQSSVFAKSDCQNASDEGSSEGNLGYNEISAGQSYRGLLAMKSGETPEEALQRHMIRLNAEVEKMGMKAIFNGTMVSAIGEPSGGGPAGPPWHIEISRPGKGEGSGNNPLNNTKYMLFTSSYGFGAKLTGRLTWLVILDRVSGECFFRSDYTYYHRGSPDLVMGHLSLGK